MHTNLGNKKLTKPFPMDGIVKKNDFFEWIKGLPYARKNHRHIKKVTTDGSIRVNLHLFDTIHRDGYACYICGVRGVRIGLTREFEGVTTLSLITRDGRWFTIDHWFPKSLGGNNAKRNRRACCNACNHARGNALSADDVAGMLERNSIDKYYNANKVDLLEILRQIGKSAT